MSAERRYGITDLLELMARLRNPAGGCPWDLQQTFATIAPHTLEECYELIDAIERGDFPQLREELGDVLFQVIFYAQLGREQGLFDFETLVHNLVAKLVRRHPHVFPSGHLYVYGEARTGEIAVEQVGHTWERIKQEERAAKSQHSVIDDVPLTLPALSRAAKLQKRAARVGFDWQNWRDVVVKIDEEKAELLEAIDSGERAHIEDEFGDLLFACVNLARFLDIDPEAALRAGNRKFERRFTYIEQSLAASGRQPQQATLAEMEALWVEAKKREARNVDVSQREGRD